jgi:Protein of unknown function (DUF2982)
MSAPPLEIRPKTSSNAALLGIGCAAFTLGGIWMVLSGEGVFVGLLSIVFFGGGGLVAIPRLLRRKVSFVLTSEALEQRYPEGSAYIPWRDVEQVGLASVFSTTMAGIRLKSYDKYLENMTPALAAFFAKNLPYMKLLARTSSLLELPAGAELWSKMRGLDVPGSLKAFGEVGSFAQALLWSRQQFGYDILLSWAELDRPATEFVTLLEAHRVAATPR